METQSSSGTMKQRTSEISDKAGDTVKKQNYGRKIHKHG